MRLKFVEEVSFKYSEATNFQNWSKTHRAETKTLGKDDVVMFVSKSGDQLVFVHGFDQFLDELGNDRSVLSTRRLRLSSGQWNPLMLQDYAGQLGIKLEGLLSFREHYKRIQVARKRGVQ